MHGNAKNQSLQEFLKSYPRKDLMQSSIEKKERKQSVPSKCKISKGLPESTAIEVCKNLELKKHSPNSSTSNSCQAPKKQPRKGENPVRLSSADVFVDCRCAWRCQNLACKTVLASEDTFCKRCSCCICHHFDDNRDPSLWLVCTSEDSGGDRCGLSCHLECALQRGRAGVVDHGQFMQLDGSYCCASCGRVSELLRNWRNQLAIAKDAVQIDVLCYRIFLSYRLLNGTSRFKELHKIVDNAKSKLETEIGPINDVLVKVAHGIVSRLSVADDVHSRCSLAIEKADEWLSSNVTAASKRRDLSHAACSFQFEEITSSSLAIVLKESSSAANSIKGYRLWYYKTSDESSIKNPVTFPKAQKRILIPYLQPCTEYTFRIVSFTENGDLGLSEAICFTKSVEIIQNHTENSGAEGYSSNINKEVKTMATRTPGSKVRKLENVAQLAREQAYSCYDEISNGEVEEESCDGSGLLKSKTGGKQQVVPSVARKLDLNVVLVPDLNAEINPPVEGFPNQENGCSSEKNELARSNGSGDSQTSTGRPIGEVPAVESRPEPRKRSGNACEKLCNGDSTFINGLPLRFSNGFGQLDDNYEYCVKVIRWLECTGHIDTDFRLKFLTWFSVRSTEQERRVVITFIRTLVEEPNSLAGQLLDSFSEIVACKRPRSGLCSNLGQ